MRLEPEDELRLNRLRRLVTGQGVLSVFLETEPGLALHHGHIAQLMDVLRDLRRTQSGDDLARVEAESERVLRFVREEYVPHGRTLAVFSSSPRRLWEALSLQLPLRSLARFAPKPYLAPLEVALEDHPRVAIALVNEERARLFTAVFSEIEAEHEVKEHVPGRQRQGGWSAFKYQRDRERHIREHFRHLVVELQDLQKARPYKWLVIGGADDATSALVNLLPKTLTPKLAGTFREELFKTDDEVVKRGAAIADEAERAEELSLAEEIRDRAFAGGPAALGWDETLQTLGEGRVHRLAIGAAKLASEEADRAIELAWQTGAGVEVVHGSAEDVLAASGGVGALLRY